MIFLKSEIGAEALGKLRALYERSFPSSEKKPFSLMEEKRECGDMELLAIVDENDTFLGLAITILSKGIVLLDYFAIEEEHRGRGIGGRALLLIKERYSERKLVLEIEDPEEKNADNAAERARRYAFYKRCGMHNMPYRVMLFGVKMILMCFLGQAIEFEEYHEIFSSVFSKRTASRVYLVN